MKESHAVGRQAKVVESVFIQVLWCCATSMSYSNRLWAAGSSLEPLSHTASDLPEPATRKPETTCAPVLGDSSLAGLIGYAQSCSYAFECLGPRSRCGSVGSKGLVFS